MTKKIDKSNPGNLVFPVDTHGFLSDFKAAGIAVASRIMGNPEKLALFHATVDELIEHVEARFAQVTTQGPAFKPRTQAFADELNKAAGVVVPEKDETPLQPSETGKDEASDIVADETVIDKVLEPAKQPPKAQPKQQPGKGKR